HPARPIDDRTMPAIAHAPSTPAVPPGLPEPTPAGTLPAPVAVRRGRVGTRIAALGAAGFVGIFALVRARRSDALDLAVTLRLQRFRSPWLDPLMRAASWPGFAPQSRLIPPVTAGLLFAKGLRLEAAFVPVAWGTALVATITKALMKRPRPVAGTDVRVVAARLGGSSFPSGHVITYAGIYGYLAFLAGTLIRPRSVRRAAVGSLVGLLALVGPSRVYQGHHWFTDVTASYLLGASYLVAVTTIYRRVKARLTGVRP
ncbi:MAG: phosphatase PAP2 family protein, partial [Chloroflexota bacterium]